MLNAITQLNYLAVLVVAVVGFAVGWLWYSPALFAKSWMTEMKLTEEMIKAANPKMCRLFTTSFIYTLISTFAIAALIKAHGSPGPVNGALFGAFVGTLVSGARLMNSGLWEHRSCRLQCINVGHEIALFTLQGAIFGVWR